MSVKDKLSAKLITFCVEYQIDSNGTQAAIRAGYSERSARTQAARLLANDNVKAYLKELFAERASKLDITANRILEEIGHVAFFDIRNIYNGSSLKEIDDLDESTAKAISSIKSRVEKLDGENFAEVVEVKSNDKLRALDMLAKHMGLYEMDNEQGKDSIVVNEIVGYGVKTIA